MIATSPNPSSYPPLIGEANGYDLIGDVHGCGQTLERLLQLLGYQKIAGVYRHRERQAIFLGDVIDRGPRIREALHLVRDMVEQGSALMIMGNHEFNAITYCTPTAPGEYLRPHSPAHVRQISETLAQFAHHPHEWQEFLRWFTDLPLFLEIQHPRTQQIFRAVHACWDQQLIDRHRAIYGDGHVNWQFIKHSVQKGSAEAITKQRLTGGVDLPLPEGETMVASDGYVRRAFRTKFWGHNTARTYGQLLFQPDPIPEHIAQAEISPEHRAQMVHYDVSQPPLFIGHYWLKGQPRPLAPNLACLDYSAVKFGRLVAYRMDGEAQLQPDKFVWVYVDP